MAHARFLAAHANPGMSLDHVLACLPDRQARIASRVVCAPHGPVRTTSGAG